jgi:hypothetical protein
MAILLLSGVITLFSVALSGISRESTLIKNRTHHNNKHTHNNSRNMYDLLDWVVCVYLSAAGTVVSVHLEHTVYQQVVTVAMLRSMSRLLSHRHTYCTYQSIRAFSSEESLYKYDHGSVEKKWQKHWEDNNIFETKRRSGAPKKYILDMFPYPSGNYLSLSSMLIVTFS